MDIAELMLWFIGFALALLMAVCVGLVAWGRVSHRTVLVGGYASVLVYCLVGAAALRWVGAHGGQFVMALRVAVLLVTTGVCIAHVVFLQYLTDKPPGANDWRPKIRRGYVITGFIVVYTVMGIIAAAHYVSILRRTPSHDDVVGFSPRFEPIKDYFLCTDRGRAIVALRPILPEGTNESVADAPARMLDGYLIREGPVDTRSNCHGWLFANGQCVIMADAVEAILQDNGYVMVTDPQPGDIIVYRDEHGVIMHSGLVRGILDDGTPLIESKWALGARYLHRPTDQIFSPMFQYYRSSRHADVPDIRRRHLVSIVMSNVQNVSPTEINSGPTGPMGVTRPTDSPGSGPPADHADTP